MHCNQKIFVDYTSSLKTGEKMKIKLRIFNSLGFVNDAKALFNRNGEKPGTEKKCFLIFNESESTKEYSTFVGEVSFDTPGYRAFYIQIKLNGKMQEIKYDTQKEEPTIAKGNYAFWELYVYYSYFKTSDKIKGGIMYQIFVDTFCSKDLPDSLKGRIVEWHAPPKWRPDQDGVYRNNQFYGGNLKGIISKLDYIKSLNVSVIYLTPIFKSPSSNRYDIEDYEKIDEMIGTWEDLAELHRKANKLGIDLIVDMVFNHSSSSNELLINNPDIYDWIHKYTIPKCWWGYTHLVEFNKYNNNYFTYLSKWLSKYSEYMDGIRLDVADNLPDFVLKYIRKNFSKYILGEIWKNAITGEFREFLQGDEVEGVMNYQFANAIYRYVRWGNYKYFKEIILGICKLYPSEALDVSPIFLSSHDIPRIPNILVSDFMKESINYENVWDIDKDSYWYNENGYDTLKFRTWEFEHEEIPEDKKKLANKLQKIAVFLQYTLPGLPSIFAGDEVGVTGFKDPSNRKTFPWDNIDKEKYNFYCDIGKFRTEYREVFADSQNFEFIVCDDTKVIYRRDEMIFAINRTDKEIGLEELFGKQIIFSLYESKDAHIIPPYGAIVFITK